MQIYHRFGNHHFNILAKSVEEAPGGLILRDTQVQVTLPDFPRAFFRHGWQSWSLTAWEDPESRLPTQKPDILHAMQTDPVYVHHRVPNGSWLGAVEFEDGNLLLLGALGLDAHVHLHGAYFHGGYETGAGDWFLAYGDECTVFKRYADLLADRFGKAIKKAAPRVWCSWYSLYTAIEESVLQRTFDGLSDMPFDVLQVDDGWQKSIGEWQANEKFPAGMKALADKIKSTGKQAGLWLAPLIAVRSSLLFRDHPDWFLKSLAGGYVSAGFNWGEQLYALDTTHPEVLDWLAKLMKQVRAWGFDYAKLDFLYAGALPGNRNQDMPREAAYRQGLMAMRNALGVDAYLLACGAPIIPSLGLCDAIRVGPDVAGEWENKRDAIWLYNPTTPGTRNAIRTTINRLWLKSILAIDPDVAYFRSKQNHLTREQKRLLQDLALICNFKATSDLPQWLEADERYALLTFLESTPEITRESRYVFSIDGVEVDFSPAMPLPAPPQGLHVLMRILIGWFGNQGRALRLLNQIGKRQLQNTTKDLRLM